MVTGAVRGQRAEPLARNTAVIADIFGQRPNANSRSPESLAAPCGPSSTRQPRGGAIMNIIVIGAAASSSSSSATTLFAADAAVRVRQFRRSHLRIGRSASTSRGERPQRSPRAAAARVRSGAARGDRSDGDPHDRDRSGDARGLLNRGRFNLHQPIDGLHQAIDMRGISGEKMD